ncbi:hypothetical protein [Prosthecomicrobium sp. N25]|uniref:hypothetical protein n=1 Tax=Prosthecomicrobium sp. N25 TaxID=3129254 RepID=UPI00307730A7
MIFFARVLDTYPHGTASTLVVAVAVTVLSAVSAWVMQRALAESRKGTKDGSDERP